MNKKLTVAGFPSRLAGGDVELSHNIDLWLKNSVDVTLVPMFGEDPEVSAIYKNLGCVVKPYSKDVFKDQIVVSFCNGNFLDKLPEIMEHGKPKLVGWANSMTWTFPKEIIAHQNKWIDKFLFVSNYQRKWLVPELSKYNKVNELEGYRPYFNPQSPIQKLEFSYRPPKDYYGCGRISRSDISKFSNDFWRIFDRVLSPIHKKIFVLGYNDNVNKHFGEKPNGLDWMTWTECAIPVSEFYNRIHTLIHKVQSSRESYCRTVIEAMRTGCAVVVEDNYAFSELIPENGVTGFRCKSSDEMSFRASELAYDEERRKKMVFAAHDYLINVLCNEEQCWLPWKRLLENA